MAILQPVAPPFVTAAHGVLQRTIGSAASHFQLSLTAPRKDGLDAFEISASKGTVHVKGTSGVALCRAAYTYLKEACHAQVTWNGGALAMPKVLPDYAKRDVVGPNKWRHYFNICTFGYTTVWWDWARWQKEIDWMALHGINMPLAMTGQDKVWQTTFRSLGVPQSSLDRWFCGPAFQPWHWMGNLNGYMGPLPQTWIDRQAALQKKILFQERSLGMKPVVPGFSGFVPTDFSKNHPKVQLQSPTAWEGFAPTTFVDVRNPMFVEIGRRFVANYRKEFGSDHFYLCDTFNEQNPQFPAATETEELAASGRSVISAMRAADPQATWVMQGWFLSNQRDYWTVPRVEALLRDVPQGGMIVLDLGANWDPVWRRLPPVQRVGWIYNTLHNFGQSSGLYGDLQRLVDRSHEDLSDPKHGRMLGMGLTPEGIDQNPVVYELMTDAMWTSDPIDVSKWMEGYVLSRYGAAPPKALEAWRILTEELYNKDLLGYRSSWHVRPMGIGVRPPYDVSKIREAVRLLLDCPQLRTNSRYQRDLVDVTRTWLGGVADFRLISALLSQQVDPAMKRDQRSRFFALLRGIDEIMATRSEHRLSTWIGAARALGNGAAEKNRLEANARTQITVWNRETLFDYASKEWAGLTNDFIGPRWRAYFAGQDANRPTDLVAWERAWDRRTGPLSESLPADSYTVARKLWQRFASESVQVRMPANVERVLGLALGKPVTASSALPGGPPELAVDGYVLDGTWGPLKDASGRKGWRAQPGPQWLEVDLQTIQRVNGVTVFPALGDPRTYRYKIEVSKDRTDYTTVVQGEGIAKLDGLFNAFPEQDARYVRITILGTSGGGSTNLIELRVYGKGHPRSDR